MRQRSVMKFRPGLELFEAKQLLSAGAATNHAAKPADPARAPALHTADAPKVHATAGLRTTSDAAAAAQNDLSPLPPAGKYGYLLFRVTKTPYQTSFRLTPPFQQVLVQSHQPVPGQVYNVCEVLVKNGTSQTFTASNGFTVRMTNQPRSFKGFPILTGNQEWKPGQEIAFYVLTKKYYPVSFVAGGFQFDMGGRSSTAVPGPSAIFLRLKYNPATFARTLDWIVEFGQGNEVGKGAIYGLPNTSVNELVDARTQRKDFAGHF